MMQVFEEFDKRFDEHLIRSQRCIRKVLGKLYWLDSIEGETKNAYRAHDSLQVSAKQVWNLLISKSILPVMEKTTEISDGAKEKLRNDKDLAFVVYELLNKLKKVETDRFHIKGIDIGNDPEIPEWDPIEILVMIESQDMEYVFNELEEITNTLYLGFDNEDIKNIRVVNIPYIP